ncbi:MAG: hypothetical protein JWM16_6198, partial [Verrucomicrobiales bacterium]|nr:hypothetical protein [Verrucomicrobiales bacterium]
MATVGIIDIGLRANVENFTKNLGKAGGSLAAFVGKAAQGLPSIGSVMAVVGVGAAKLDRSIAGLSRQFIGMGTSAVSAVTSGLKAMTIAGLGAVDATGELADKLGTSGGDLAAFQYAVKLTGGPVEMLPEILGKLNSTLGQAAQAATPAGAALKRLGLDAATLAKAGPIEATKAIADKLARIENPAARAAAAVAIFGEQGSKLAGTLKVGRDGINALEAEARGLGVALSDIDYAKAAEANNAIDRVHTTIGAIGNQLAVQLAPYVTAAANQFVDMAKSGEGMGPRVSKSLGWVGSALGAVADSTQYLQAAFYGISTVSSKVFGALVKAIGWAGKQLENLINLIPGMNVSFTDSLDAIGAHFDQLVDENFAAMKDAWTKDAPSAQVASFFKGIEDGANKSAEAMTKAGTATRGLGDELGQTAAKV